MSISSIVSLDEEVNYREDLFFCKIIVDVIILEYFVFL